MTHGIILLQKPEGLSSHQVVEKVRRLLRIKRVGHAGTLDPFATGLLILLVGQATRLSKYLTDEDKHYRAFCVWGAATDTADRTGKVISQVDTPMPDEDRIREAMTGFLGPQMQLPPMYSAKKLGGKPLYKFARRGTEVAREPVPIRIDSLELIERKNDGFSFEVRCGKGTYVRTLAEDLCVALGGLGHLGALHRLSSGGFGENAAVTLQKLTEAVDQENLESRTISLETICERFAPVVLNEAAAQAMAYGRVPTRDCIVSAQNCRDKDVVRFLAPSGRLLALAVATADFQADELFVAKNAKPFKIDMNFVAESASKKP